MAWMRLLLVMGMALHSITALCGPSAGPKFYIIGEEEEVAANASAATKVVQFLESPASKGAVIAVRGTQLATRDVLIIDRINRTHLLRTVGTMEESGKLTVGVTGAAAAGGLALYAVAASDAVLLAGIFKSGYDVGTKLVELDRKHTNGKLLVRPTEIVLTAPFWLIRHAQDSVESALGSK